MHAFISGESYWGRGRPRDQVEQAIRGSARVVGLYRGREQVGFARAVSDRTIVAYLADVYVLSDCRGRGLGVELVREIVDTDFGPNVRWLLHTADAQDMYAKLGFSGDAATYRLMQRGLASGRGGRASGEQPE